MSADSPRHVRSGGPLTVPSQPPSDRSIIDTVSGFINDVTLSSSSAIDSKDIIQWARFETADINEPTSEGDGDNDTSPLLLILGYGSGVQVWLIPPNGDAQEVLSWRQGTVRVLRILPTPQHGDCFASKRPLIALCDSISPGPTFCSLSFISIRGGEQVKSIKFKNPILDVVANKRSVVISFSERFAVFDAATLEDRISVTTCYPCPCPLGGNNPINPLALGDRWLAYADKKLNPSKRSSGGCEGEGVSSYTATVLHAAKSLSKGLRGLGESVAHSLAGGRSTSQSPSPPNTDSQQPGVITILDIEGNNEEDCLDGEETYDPIVAHFVAHSEAIIALKFDASGMLLITADRRGHDFHVFRINPHPCGPSLAAVHHLYILHRGDTTAKVQDIAVSSDSRWAAVSTLRGTTHVFAISPYGGASGVRTHTQPRVVNRLSRFHRSAGLPIHATASARAGSPVGDGMGQGAWFPNPRLPPYPLPVTLQPLAQLRPTATLPTHTITRTSSGRQRLSSLSEESSSAPLLARARFGSAGVRGAPSSAAPPVSPACPALYLMAANGCLVHLVLHPRPARSVPKEKICDESPIELEVESIAQWPLQRPSAAADLLAPLPPSNPLLQPLSCRRCADMYMSEEERWLSQVEIVTHAGPHRRLWMGPQFVFKTYNCTGSSSSLSEAETVEVEAGPVARSNPVNMPGVRPLVPVLIDSGSASSLEHSPSDGFRRKSLLAESGRAASVCDVQLKEDLAEAMKEDHVWPRTERRSGCESGVARAVGPLGTVVVPTPCVGPPPADDVDAYTLSNEDEACFRPVVRAPASLPLQPDIVVRPLPRDTTIPVQTVDNFPVPASANPMPLDTHVVIPAALNTVHNWLSDDPVATNPAISRQILIDSKGTSVCDKSVLTVDSTKLQDKSSENTIERTEKHKTKSNIKNSSQDVTLNENIVDSKPYDTNKDLKRMESEIGKNDSVRDIVSAANVEKVESVDAKSLPKLKQAADDIQPVAKVRVKKSPTLKLVCDRNDSDISVKDNKIKDVKELKIVEENKQLSASKPKINKNIEQVKENQEITGIKRTKEPKESKPKREVEEVCELKETKLSKETKAVKNNKVTKEVNPEKEIKIKEQKEKDSKEAKVVPENETKQYSECTKISVTTEPKKDSQDYKEVKESKDSDLKEVKGDKLSKDCKSRPEEKDYEGKDVEPSVAATFKFSIKKESLETRPAKTRTDDVKTEEQAWDLLLNEPEKTTVAVDKSEESKLKLKKGRKLRKDETQERSSEDNFVEIHAIEEKQSKEELVSISLPSEKLESSYVSKVKKSRSKSRTPERKKENQCDRKVEEWLRHSQELELTSVCKSQVKNDEATVIDIQPLPGPSSLVRKGYSNILKTKTHADGTASESTSLIIKDSTKSKKSKSLSPYPESGRKHVDKTEVHKKDVYVIDTAKDDFPEIQITRGKLPRKISPQPLEKKAEEIEKPVKSWSSIAASKGSKRVEPLEKKVDLIEITDETENPSSSSNVCLQDKLVELCKRNDIMVAECDSPTELTFVEDLPPLEPLDFALDDFKLDVMKESLFDANDSKSSPICKINIEDIFTSIKEGTNKVIESSMFNLVDLEKMPPKKEKGFSVVECHKITTQEVKIDDDKLEDNEGMEKSSDEDLTSPLVSTDSDKEDKKNIGASNLTLPSSKQSSKAKKSRRKKK